jgi:hypothetical protein
MPSTVEPYQDGYCSLAENIQNAQAKKFRICEKKLSLGVLLCAKLLRIQCMKLQNIIIFFDRRWLRHDIFELLQPLFF